MMIQGVSISEMINQSMTVLTKPSVASFEQYERRGGMREALIYIGVAAALAGVAGLLFGLLGGVSGAISGLIGGVLRPLIGFFIFAYLIFFVGKQFGGTGTQDEVFYTTALYAAPIYAITGVVGAIPLLSCALLPVTFVLGIYQIYLGYLATRSSMNLNQNNAIITMVVAFVVQFIAATLIFGALFLAVFGAGAANGTLNP